MESAPLLVVFFAVGFGCFYWINNIIKAVGSLFGISIVLSGILGIVTQGWGIVVLLLYPQVWIPALVLGAVLGWFVRWMFEAEAKEKSQ
jgi:hypothetical protein